MRRALPYVVGVVLVVAIGAVVWQTYRATPERGSSVVEESERGLQPQVALGFEPLDLSAATAAREALVARARIPDDDSIGPRLLAAYEGLGLLSASGGRQNDPLALMGGLERFSKTAQEAVISYGPEGYAAIGEQVYARFLGALQVIGAPNPAKLEGVPREKAALVAAVLVGESWHRGLDVITYVGDFLAVARDEGLLTDEGALDPRHEELVHLLFRHIWAQQASEALPLDQALTPAELIAVRRWQIEGSKAPPQRKLQILAKLRPTTQGYDFDRAEAVLRVQMGDTEGAEAALQRARDVAQANGDGARAGAIEADLALLRGER